MIKLPENAREFSIISSTIKLKAILFKTEEDEPLGTIILLHGIHCSKFTLLSLKDVLLTKGYNAVLMDIRGHNDVKDQYLTYGFYEKRDISVLIDTLYANGLKHNLGVWGQSLGASIGIQAMAYDKRITFGIIESAFSDFPKIVHAYTKRIVGFDIPFLTDYIIYRAGKMAKFNPMDVRPFMMAKNITQPIIAVHGKQDIHIAYKNALVNFDAITSSKKRIFLLDSADHTNVWRIGGDKYFSAVFQFIKCATQNN